MDAKASLTGFLGTLTDEENDYFERSLTHWECPLTSEQILCQPTLPRRSKTC